MPKISTAVITYNEERNIERCLKSVAPFSDEILVVDSHSTDDTAAIARRMGARVITKDWPGYGRQRQFALDNASNDWVFVIDADEAVSPELGEEIRSLDYSHDGYEVPRAVWYLNRWIKHGVWYPAYVVRLFRKSNARVTDDAIHESVRVSGRITRLRGDLLHYSYRDIEHHLDKMNEFTTISARSMLGGSHRAGLAGVVFFPFLEFFKTYVVKRGFLDGSAGLQISVLHAFYVFLKYAKLREMSFNAGEENRAAISGRDFREPPAEGLR